MPTVCMNARNPRAPRFSNDRTLGASTTRNTIRGSQLIAYPRRVRMDLDLPAGTRRVTSITWLDGPPEIIFNHPAIHSWSDLSRLQRHAKKLLSILDLFLLRSFGLLSSPIDDILVSHLLLCGATPLPLARTTKHKPGLVRPFCTAPLSPITRTYRRIDRAPHSTLFSFRSSLSFVFSIVGVGDTFVMNCSRVVARLEGS